VPRRSVAATPEQWELVSRYVLSRRPQLYSTIAAAAEASNGASASVWGHIENHTQKNGTMAEQSIRAICETLRWTPDSIERILAGGEPIEMDPETTPDAYAGLAARVARIEAQLGITPLSEATVRSQAHAASAEAEKAAAIEAAGDGSVPPEELDAG
jgi:hypothetical protein